MTKASGTLADVRWKKLLSEERLRESLVKGRSQYDARSAFENDYDRVVFSSSFRRLQDKAQVFSLDSHDFVRTRLTHSLEVSTIGRALGEGIAVSLCLPKAELGTIVATACLLHDIGNPPFGHSGEAAIGEWFKKNLVAGRKLSMPDEQQTKDLTLFEGNAQAIRIATRTQWSGTDFGMNLTAATLATLIKYPCGSHERAEGITGQKKHGYLRADQGSFNRIRESTGLTGHKRHPLAYLVEAADDIAYVTGDIEDVLKKGLVDFATIREVLGQANSEESKECVKKYLVESYDRYGTDLEVRDRQQMAVQRFTQMAIRLMMRESIECFIRNADPILEGEFDRSIVEEMPMSDLANALRKIMEKGVYPDVAIAHREQASRTVLHRLLDTVVDELLDRPDGPLARRVYRKAPANPGDSSSLSDNYVLSLRATDYVSGMTDGFALQQYQRISAMNARL